MMRMIKNSFNFEKFLINKALFGQSLNEYLQKKWIVYWVPTLRIQSLFVSIQFGLDLIVQDRPNMAVTYALSLTASKNWQGCLHPKC